MHSYVTCALCVVVDACAQMGAARSVTLLAGYALLGLGLRITALPWGNGTRFGDLPVSQLVRNPRPRVCPVQGKDAELAAMLEEYDAIDEFTEENTVRGASCCSACSDREQAFLQLPV